MSCSATCSGSITWPPASAAAPSRCWCSPATSPPPVGRAGAPGRGLPGRGVRGRGVPAGRGGDRGRAARGRPRLRRRHPPARRADRERHHVLASRPAGGGHRPGRERRGLGRADRGPRPGHVGLGPHRREPDPGRAARGRPQALLDARSARGGPPGPAPRHHRGAGLDTWRRRHRIGHPARPAHHPPRPRPHTGAPDGPGPGPPPPRAVADHGLRISAATPSPRRGARPHAPQGPAEARRGGAGGTGPRSPRHTPPQRRHTIPAAAVPPGCRDVARRAGAGPALLHRQRPAPPHPGHQPRATGRRARTRPDPGRACQPTRRPRRGRAEATRSLLTGFQAGQRAAFEDLSAGATSLDPQDVAALGSLGDDRR
jgi:hypothetical protein